MAKQRFRVGIVGLTPGRSWGVVAHLPALRALSEDFEVVGVANSSPASGQAAAAALGLPRAFADVAELVASPDVDIVAVTVKAPSHAGVVTAALQAGKPVFCEWPLGANLAEARAMAGLARAKGVMGVIGTQALGSPEFDRLRQLVADGYVGAVQAVTLVGTSMVGGRETAPAGAYLLERKNGANLLTIPVGHTLAPLIDILGDIVEVSAVLGNRWPMVRLAGSDQMLPKTSPDQVLVAGVLEGGAPISIHYRGGGPPGMGLLLEIVGETGTLQVTGENGHAQYVPLTIRGAQGDGQALEVLAEPSRTGARDELVPHNVARLYAMMAKDLRTGSRTAPSFDDAVRLHRVIAAIEQASDTGARVSPQSL